MTQEFDAARIVELEALVAKLRAALLAQRWFRHFNHCTCKGCDDIRALIDTTKPPPRSMT